MRKFVLKFLKFLLAPVLLFLVVDSVINLLAKNNGLNELMESKIKALPIHKDKINIIIAGDSRAERQLIPKVIEEITGFNTINIAVSNGELVTVVETLKDHYATTDFITIISTSSFQTNDGAVDVGYLSKKCFQKASILDKFKLSDSNIVSSIKMYQRLIKEVVLSLTNDYERCEESLIKTKGYFAVSGNFKKFKSSFEIEKYIENHRHYKNLKNNGIRFEVFKESLKELNKLSRYSMILQPPLSPYGKKITKDTKIEKAEITFSRRLDSLVKENDYVKLQDFYSKELLSLPDSLYYDYYHLNSAGAKVYSMKVASLLNEQIKKIIN